MPAPGRVAAEIRGRAGSSPPPHRPGTWASRSHFRDRSHGWGLLTCRDYSNSITKHGSSVASVQNVPTCLRGSFRRLMCHCEEVTGGLGAAQGPSAGATSWHLREPGRYQPPWCTDTARWPDSVAGAEQRQVAAQLLSSGTSLSVTGSGSFSGMSESVQCAHTISVTWKENNGGRESPEASSSALSPRGLCSLKVRSGPCNPGSCPKDGPAGGLVSPLSPADWGRLCPVSAWPPASSCFPTPRGCMWEGLCGCRAPTGAGPRPAGTPRKVLTLNLQRPPEMDENQETLLPAALPQRRGLRTSFLHPALNSRAGGI